MCRVARIANVVSAGRATPQVPCLVRIGDLAGAALALARKQIVCSRRRSCLLLPISFDKPVPIGTRMCGYGKLTAYAWRSNWNRVAVWVIQPPRWHWAGRCTDMDRVVSSPSQVLQVIAQCNFRTGTIGCCSSDSFREERRGANPVCLSDV